MYKRALVDTLVQRMNEPRRFIQILLGPRQTGKTTALSQALEKIAIPQINVAVNEHGASVDWLRAQWTRARALFSSDVESVLLVIDEVQYVHNWADVTKALWDEDARAGIDLRVVLSGSSATLLRSGINESLAGRFETIYSTHWTYSECKCAFGLTLDDFLYFGGYPGALPLRDDENRWAAYMTGSIIDPCISKDILLLEDVRNPALLSRLFYLGAPYSGQEMSYRKLLGQLDDRGNTATVAHYLSLLEQAGMMSGLQKYDPKLLREKASSPRLLVHDTALMSATYGTRRRDLLTNPSLRGHLVETAVGAYLLARSKTENFSVNWWREGTSEVDFVIWNAHDTLAIEVKSGRVKRTGGLDKFVLTYPFAKTLVVGSAACSVEEFLLGNIALL